MSSLLNQAIDQTHLPTLIQRVSGDVTGLSLTHSSTISDPTPGIEDRRPSFSVWQRSNGTWLWKKRGEQPSTGNAYGFLLRLGWRSEDACAYLLDQAGLASTSLSAQPVAPRVPAPPPSVLSLAQEAQLTFTLPRPTDFRQLRRHLEALTGADEPSQGSNDVVCGLPSTSNP